MAAVMIKTLIGYLLMTISVVGMIFFAGVILLFWDLSDPRHYLTAAISIAVFGFIFWISRKILIQNPSNLEN